jgi:hypothetical protein
MFRWMLLVPVLLVLVSASCDKISTIGRASTLGEREKDPMAVAVAAPATTGPLSPDDYATWVNSADSRLGTTHAYQHFSYGLRYDPVELIALRRLKGQQLSATSLQNKKSELGNFQYYTLTIGTATGEDIIKYRATSLQERQERAQYFAFDMQRDIKLVDGTDTLQCAMFHYESNFGVKPYTNFILAFTGGHADGKHQDKTLILYDRLFGNGVVTLSLYARDLNRIPALTINTPQK